MSVTNNTETTKAFLRRLRPNGERKFVVRFQHPPGGKKGKDGKPFHMCFAVRELDDIFEHPAWKINAHKATVHYCTSPVHTIRAFARDWNMASLHAMHFDIDFIQETDTDGQDFWSECRERCTEVNIWVRSSLKGVQGYLMLDQPIEFPKGDWDNTKVEEADPEDDGEDEDAPSNDPHSKHFDDLKDRSVTKGKLSERTMHPTAARRGKDIKELLCHIAYYYGGDLAVATVPRLMRLPGTHNFKRSEPFYCEWKEGDRKEPYTYEQLVKRYPYNDTLAPFAHAVAICDVLRRSPSFKPGNRNKVMFQVLGTIRRSGLDKESCLSFVKFVHKVWANEDQFVTASNVDLVYEKEYKEVAGLRSDWQGLNLMAEAQAIEKILSGDKGWIEFKEAYTRKCHNPWKPDLPENDPLADANALDVEQFEQREDGVYFWQVAQGEKGEQWVRMSNFTLLPIQRVIRPRFGMPAEEFETWECSFEKRTKRFAWDGTTNKDFGRFKTIRDLPGGIMWHNPYNWTLYIQWLREKYKLKSELIEIDYFGVLDVPEKPTILLPGEEHKRYILATIEETTVKSYAFREVPEEEWRFFLPLFAERLSLYYEPKVAWAVLGWFFAGLTQAFVRKSSLNAFPILTMNGPTSSGKTQLVCKALGHMFGTEYVSAASTLASLRSMGHSNNILPILLDEWAIMDEREIRAAQIHLRNCYDELARTVRSINGSQRRYVPRAPIYVGGEVSFLNDANVNRNYNIPVDDKFLIKMKADPDAKERGRRLDRWMTHSQWGGILSSLGTQWVRRTLPDIPDMIEHARDLIDARMPESSLHRELTNRATILHGLRSLMAMYEDMGLDPPLSEKKAIRYTLDADPVLGRSASSNTFKLLWNATDTLIMEARMRNQSFEHEIYEYETSNAKESKYIYFDLHRWYDQVKSHVKTSDSASLSTEGSFIQLIKSVIGLEASPFKKIVGEFNGLIGDVVRVDVEILREDFGKNVSLWGVMPGER